MRNFVSWESEFNVLFWLLCLVLNFRTSDRDFNLQCNILSFLHTAWCRFYARTSRQYVELESNSLHGQHVNKKPRLPRQPDYTVHVDANGSNCSDDGVNMGRAIAGPRQQFVSDAEAVNRQMLLNFQRSNFINWMPFSLLHTGQRLHALATRTNAYVNGDMF